MTIEEATEFIAQSVKSDVDMALVADVIKALAQESVLDKLRSEIYIQYKWLISTSYTIRDVYIAFNSIFDTIDKMKEEMEEKRTMKTKLHVVTAVKVPSYLIVLEFAEANDGRKICKILDRDGGKWWIDAELLEIKEEEV